MRPPVQRDEVNEKVSKGKKVRLGKVYHATIFFQNDFFFCRL